MMNQKNTNTPDWHPSYWNDEKHGSKWNRVQEALKRDWEQTKADFSSKGKELNQDVVDTVKQAVGSEPIPPANQPNPEPRNWDEIRPAIAYGFGAHEEYGTQYNTWDDKLETRLAKEWDKDKTGKSFDEVKPIVRRGWDYKPQ